MNLVGTCASTTIRWSGPMDLYLCGHKGLAAARAIVESSSISVIRTVVVAKDEGILNDPVDEISKILSGHGIQVTFDDPTDTAKFVALAVGWRSLIHSEYEHLFVVHDSLLPHLRGWNPLVTSLIEGDEAIGASLIVASNGFDEGPIVAQFRIEITGPIRIDGALSKICDGIFGLVTNFCTSLRTAGVKAVPQDNSKATYSLWRDELDYLIDWRWDAERIHRHILAVGSPYGGARTHLGEELVAVHDAEVVFPDPSIVNRDPGKILNIRNGFPLVVCGSGLLKLTDIRSPSGNAPLVLTKIRQRFS